MNIFCTPKTACKKQGGDCIYYSSTYLSGPNIQEGDVFNVVVQKLSAFIGTIDPGSALIATTPLTISLGIISIPPATSIASGYLTATDWNTFNSKVSPSRTISTTGPLTGGGDLSTNRTIGIQVANGSQNGYLSSSDWTTFNNKISNLANTITTGAQVWKDTVGTVSNLRRIQAGVNVTVTETTDAIIIDSTGGGGGGGSLSGTLFS